MKKPIRRLKFPIFMDSCITVFLIFILITILSGCKKMVLKSHWLDREITIDGDHSDWKNRLTYIEKKDLSVGLINDEEYLYLCLVPGDRQVQNQIIKLGFTLWFDAKGTEEKTFGIRYPLGMMESGMSIRELGFGPDRFNDNLDTNRQYELLKMTLSELELLGPEKGDVQRIHIDQVESIEVEVGNRGGPFVYELKIPLVKDDAHPYYIDIGPRLMMTIGYETAEIDREKMMSGMKGRMGGMGGGIRGGGMSGRGMGGGMRGGMRGGNRFQKPEPLKGWIEVHLAKKQNEVSIIFM